MEVLVVLVQICDQEQQATWVTQSNSIQFTLVRYTLKLPMLAIEGQHALLQIVIPSHLTWVLRPFNPEYYLLYLFLCEIKLSYHLELLQAHHQGLLESFIKLHFPLVFLLFMNQFEHQLQPFTMQAIVFINREIRGQI